MSEANKSSATPKEIIAEIQKGLRHSEAEERLKSIEKLGALTYSSEGVLRQLEKLAAKDRSIAVRAAAITALDFPVNRQIFKRLSKLPQMTREILVNEIRQWKKEGLLREEIATTLEKRYSFDVKPAPVPDPVPATVQKAEVRPVAASIATPAPKKIPAPQPPKPKKPKRSLAQVLFSESSIKIALYLGAFFVIAAALIFAATIESLRFPILLFVTIGFLVGALTLKKRLPQPSFTLFIIFSTLLAVDAGVLADMLNLRSDANSLYWAIVFFFVAAVWGWSIWFYESRFFSVMAFFALILGGINFANIFDVPLALDLLIITFASWGALIASKLLVKWKDRDFVKPLFFLTQFVLLGTLAVSFFSLPFMGSRWSDAWWFAGGVTWLLAASAYILSNLFWEMAIFPYLAVGALIPVVWISFNGFGDLSSALQVFLAWLWGSVFVAAHVAFSDFIKSEKWKKYSLPFLLGSGFVFAGALSLASARAFDINRITPLFFVLLGIAISYIAFHIYRPQIIFWSIGLVSALGAYFSFFALPFLKNTEIFMGYQLFGVSLLLLLPDALMPRTRKEIPWRLPLQVLGGITTFAFINIPRETDLQAAMLLGLMALFFFFYAMRLRVFLAYIAAGFLTFSALYTSYLFSYHIWLPVLIILSALYYGVGVFLRRKEDWSNVFRYSGLILGSIIIFLGMTTLENGWGWYALVVALLFALETFIWKSAWMELGIHFFLALAFYGILDSSNIHEPLSYILLSIGLVWLGTDMLLERTLKIERPLQTPLHFAVGMIVGLNTFLLAGNLYSETLAAVICFSAYALFFLGYALYYRKELFKFFFTAYLSFAAIALLQYFEIALYWLPILFVLSALYYGLGAWARKSLWSSPLRISGLALASALILNGVASPEAYIGWYALFLALAYTFETFIRRSQWLEAGTYILLGIAVYSIFRDANIQDELTYTFLVVGLLWLMLDAIFERTLKIIRPLHQPVQIAAGILVFANTANLLSNLSAHALPATISFGVYALFFVGYALYKKEPRLGYLATGYLPLGVLALLQHLDQERWLFPLIFVAVLYYGVGFLIKKGEHVKWQEMLTFSSLILGTLVALSAPFEDSGLVASIPVAITATLYATHAFRKKNIWLGFPANAFYLMAYFMILFNFEIDQPQFFTVVAAVLGMLMHYLLVRSGSKTAAFITGMLSQLVLLSTTYFQLVSEEQFIYFVVLFFQAIAVLIYGIVIRSKSLVITPIIFLILSVITVTLGLLDGWPTIFLIGCTGVFLIAFGIGALLLREKVADLRERLDDWDA